MPLSEDEQRILRQIEEQLQRDSKFGRQTNPARVGRSRALPLVALAVVACVASVLLIGVSPYAAFAAFVAAVWFGGAAQQRLTGRGFGVATDLADGLRSRFQPRPRD